MSNGEKKEKKNSFSTNVIIVEDEMSLSTKKTIGSGKSSNKQINNNKTDTKENRKETKNNDKNSEISGKSSKVNCGGCEGGGLMKLLSVLKFWEFNKNKDEKGEKDENKEKPQKVEEELKSPERNKEDNTLDNSNEPATADRLNGSSRNQLNSPFKSRLYDSSNVIGEIEDEENYDEEEEEQKEEDDKKKKAATTNIYLRSPKKSKKSFKNSRSLNQKTDEKKENETTGQGSLAIILEEMYRVISVVTNESDKKTKFSISTYAKSIKSKKKGANGLPKEEDIENLIEKNSFPCQLNDFTNLMFDIDEMDLFYQTFSINEATEYHIERDEEICCLMEGLYWKEKTKGDRIFLIITTLKLIILDVITDTTVSVSLTLSLGDIESVFFSDDKFYLIVNSDDDKIKLLYEMGYKGYHPEKDQKFYKTEAKNKENTFLFIVTLWRMKFINNQSFLRVMKIPNLTHTDVKLKYNNYLFDVLKKIQDNSSLKDIKTILTEKDGKAANNKMKKMKKSEDQLCLAFIMIPHKEKGNEFSNDKYGYCQVIVKIIFDHLVIYDFNNDHLCYIELSSIVKIAINESRLLVIIFFHDGKDFEKIVLFTNKQDDEEFELFKPIYVFLIEANRRKTLNFEFWTGTLEIIFNNNILNDDWDFFDLIKNSHRLKRQQESDTEIKRKAKNLKHRVIVEKVDLQAKIASVEVAEYDCCCRKVKKPENKPKETVKEDNNENVKNNNDNKKDEPTPEKSSCIIF